MNKKQQYAKNSSYSYIFGLDVFGLGVGAEDSTALQHLWQKDY